MDVSCIECQQNINLADDDYVLYNDKYYHRECINLPHCCDCLEPIIDNIFTYRGQEYHDECLQKICKCKCKFCQDFIDDKEKIQCNDRLFSGSTDEYCCASCSYDMIKCPKCCTNILQKCYFYNQCKGNAKTCVSCKTNFIQEYCDGCR